MAKRYKTRRLSIHRNYEIGEVADLIGAHPQTIRGWVVTGTLPVCAANRPILIAGDDLLAFLRNRGNRSRRPLGPNQFYCLRCREARNAAGKMADFEPRSDTGGRLVAICAECEAMVYRTVRFDRLKTVAPDLQVTFGSAAASLDDPANPA
ncbi:MAG: helix-turn-helix domain-containing protein [Parvularculaceae bacterium]|nr:helix-turn-helix domain-containing protein [Parvularculaceae bacterium]